MKNLKLDRRLFLKGSLATGALATGTLAGLGFPGQRAIAAVPGIRARDWHTLPRNDGATLEALPGELGDLQLWRANDGSFEPTRVFTSTIERDFGRFNMVGVRWVADVPEGTRLQLEVRGSRDGSTWGPWAKLGHVMEGREEREGEEAETFADVVDLDRVVAVQYRLILGTTDPRLTPTVRRVTVSQIDSLDSPTLHDLDSRGSAIPLRVGNGSPPTARLILRDGPNGWGPEYFPPGSPMYWEPYSGMYPYQYVTLHHTAGVNNPENPVASVRGVWYFHTYIRGWGDVGYHFLVDQYGNVYEGRYGGDGTEAGHAYRYNHFNCGISLLGQFQPNEPGQDPSGDPSSAALESAMRMAALEAAYHGFNPLELAAYPKPSGSCRPQLANYRICGHRDWGRSTSCIRTSCPGQNLYKHLPGIRTAAAQLIPSIRDFHLMEILNRQYR